MKKVFITFLMIFGCLSIFGNGNTEKSSSDIKLLYFTLPRETQVILTMEKLLVENNTNYKIDLQNIDQVSLGWAALQAGDADGYMEYTGTAYTTILQQTITDDVLDRDVMKSTVQKLLHEKGYRLLENLGFQNTYAVAVTKEFAEKYNLKKISDLIPIASDLKFACNADFLNRDGVLSYTTMCQKYGLKFKSAVSMDIGLMYKAINNDDIQAIIAYTTDGAVIDQNLVCLEDDLSVFPPYDACILIRESVLDKNPGLEDALNLLAGHISAEEMQEMNRAIMADEISDYDMAVKFLRNKGFIK